MQFHEYRTLWSEMQGQLPRQVTEERFYATAMAGGDTDTNGAIAGALLGAVHGRDAIPPRWLDSIVSCHPLPKSGTAHALPVDFWPVDALWLAERLLLLGFEARDVDKVLE